MTLRIRDQARIVTLIRQSVTDSENRLRRISSSVTTDEKRCERYLCLSSATVAFRTGSYSKLMCEPCAKMEWGGSILLGACVYCGIPVYVSKSYAHYVTNVHSSPVAIVCTSACHTP